MASFADLATCKVTPTDPGVVAGYQFLYDWSKARDPQAIARWVTTNWPPNAAAATNPFWTGKLGMTISGDWRISEQAEYAPQGNYGFTFIPVPKAGDAERDVGRWLVYGPDPRFGCQGPGDRLHEVHRRAGRAGDLHQGDRRTCRR